MICLKLDAINDALGPNLCCRRLTLPTLERFRHTMEPTSPQPPQASSTNKSSKSLNDLEKNKNKLILRLTSLRFQVAGHASLLQIQPNLLLKPLIPLEYGIYNQIFFKTKNHPLSKFLPQYFHRIECTLWARPASNGYPSFNHTLPRSKIDMKRFQSPSASIVIEEGSHIQAGGIRVEGKVDFGNLISSQLIINAETSAIPSSVPPIRRKKIKRPKVKGDFRHDTVHPVSLNTATAWSNRKFSFDLREIVADGSPTFQYLVFENLCHGMHYPCIMDIKLGLRQHSDDATLKKVFSQIQKCKDTTSSTLGMRFAGYQKYNPETNQYFCLDKYLGRNLDDISFKETIKQFLSNDKGLLSHLFPFYLNKINSLLKAVQSTDRERYYGVSLLFIYETHQHNNEMLKTELDHKEAFHKIVVSPNKGDEPNPLNIRLEKAVQAVRNFQNPSSGSSPRFQDIRLVDFAHSYSNYHQPSFDNGLLFGLSNMWDILFDIIKTNDPSPKSIIDSIHPKTPLKLNLDRGRFEAEWHDGCEKTFKE